MRFGFYIRFAVGGIRRNKRLFVPYLLTCVGMTAMYHIVFALSKTTDFEAMRGGGFLQWALELGAGVIGVFSLIFLFYTNSFLVRRRDREFGLYHVLGMGKRELTRVLFWQTLIIALVSLCGGLLLGALLYKFFELGMVNLTGGEVTYSLSVSMDSVRATSLLFGGIFLLIFLNSVRKLYRSGATELLRSESVGEKPPKANWLLALFGLVILAAAYAIAVSIDNPLDAFIWFFVAVIMVIVATYLLFIAGSVALCRLLQKQKRYYYNPKHFVSVSSMAYRMKRNGAGLASICILLTMVLVMVSTTACLYFGKERALSVRYPRNMIVEFMPDDAGGLADAAADAYRDLVWDSLHESGVQEQTPLEYRSAAVSGVVEDGVLRYDPAALADFRLNTYSSLLTVYLIPLSDYNRAVGSETVLASGEALLYTYRTAYTAQTFAIEGMRGEPLRIAATLEAFPFCGYDETVNLLPCIYLVVPDFDAVLAELSALSLTGGEEAVMLRWYYGVNLTEEDDAQIAAFDNLRAAIRSAAIADSDFVQAYATYCKAAEREEVFAEFGALFFLGILLSIVFLAAAVLMTYYKQITEGYEDQARFAIMQKVGMTRREVRRSINSQMLTVFFLPLLAAGMHLCFAFPMLRKLLLLFSLTDVRFLAICTLVCFLIFGAFYLIVYRLTSNGYYSIVSGLRKTE